MKKNVIILSTMMISSFVFSQVGINTANPTTTLDVTAKNPTGTTTNIDGLLVPRVDRQRAQSMAGVPTSTLVYVNNIATGTATGNAVNIDATGYYYFDGGVWTKLKNPATQFYDWLKSGDAQPTASGDNSVNIYHVGGNVGIGTNAPVGRLHIYNPTNGSETGNDFLFDDESPIAQIPGMVFRRSNAGVNLSTDNMIGAIVFNPKINGTFGYNGSGIRSFYRGNGTNMLNNLVFNINANQEAMRIDETGKVGIGTTTPATKLEINNGTTAGAIKIVDGTQGINKVLMSDTNGVGKWSSLPGSWFGLLNDGVSNSSVSQINFTSSSLIGQGGAANSATDAITVPSAGLYEVTVSAWTWIGNGNTPGVYLTTWNIRRNGANLVTPHYASPSGAYGTQTSTTNYINLNAGDVITLFMANTFGSPQPADKARGVSLAVKLIQ